MIEPQTIQPALRKSPPIAAWRIRFVPEPPSGARVLRSFADPVVAHAIVESVDPAAIADLRDDICIVHVLQPNSPAAQSIRETWIPAGDLPATIVSLEDGRLHWKNGRALLEGACADVTPILTAIAEFAFHEAQLRKLEEQLRPIEIAAPSHVSVAYQIRENDKAAWPRLAETAGQLAQLRLMAARLEPRAYCPPRDLPAPSRRLAARLATRADIEDRLEALSARLEACEDLYEGAIDRISEHRWGRKGSRLEMAIIALLSIEVILLLIDFAVRAFNPFAH